MIKLVRSGLQTVQVVLAGLIICVGLPVLAAEGFPDLGGAEVKAGVGDKLETASKGIVEAGEEAVSEAEKMWRRIDANRLKNRSVDGLVAWVIVGLMVGGLAGMIASMRRTGYGPVVHVIAGLVGSFLGSLVVAAFDMDFGWGPVLIRYEELAMALGGAVVILLLSRFIVWNWRRNRAKKRV